MQLLNSSAASRALRFTLILCLGGLVGAGALRTVQHLKFEIPNPSATIADGAVYEGDMIDGVLNGQGRMRWHNGDRYEGGFKNGLFHGQGTFKGADGTSYEGDYKAGAATGKGTLIYSDKEQYTGEVQNSRLQGYGVFKSHGTVYEGEFAANVFHGKGKFSDTQGDTYTGSFENGKFQGQGVYVTADGRSYTGEFVAGVFTGEGQYNDDEGVSYEGDFRDWYYHGEGELTVKNGDRYSGQFEDGELNGNGKYFGINGASYQGEFEYGQYSGKGIYTSQTGDVFEGSFRYHRYDGAGTLTYAKPLDNIDKIEGIWRRGELIQATNQAFLPNPGIVNETVLYNQHELLEKNWRGIEANDPNKTEMYFLGISGDGSQAVFRREVLYVKNYFDSQLQTRNKSIALINSRRTVTEYPLATNTSIRKTLALIAERMDPQNDILFIYMTSHGSSDFDLSLNQTRMQLPDLSAQALADMLNELPIRWKVIVVSACYSGGFIPPLESDETLIITASAAKKTSFGCSDEAEFTYFGKAYFKDALNETDDFVAAFDHALELVKEREKLQGYDHSQPQIHKPQAIQKQLARWHSERGSDIESVSIDPH